jgi:hypothetical protein
VILQLSPWRRTAISSLQHSYLLGATQLSPLFSTAASHLIGQAAVCIFNITFANISFANLTILQSYNWFFAASTHHSCGQEEARGKLKIKA